MSLRSRRSVTLSVATLGALSLAACEDSAPVGPGEEEGVATLTVDAAEDWAFVSLAGGEAVAVTVGDPATSSTWDLGFFATSVMLNGGAAGPAGVSGYCICQNEGATEAEILAMTAETERADFDAVDASALPTDPEEWTSDALAPAIDGWYSYDFTTHTVSAAPENVWKVRTASGDAFAKFRVLSVEDATQQHAGRVRFEYALQPSAGAAFGAARTATVDLSDGPVAFDLESGAVVSGGSGWDLRFAGWDIRVNGGVSGSGSAGASRAEGTFDSIEDASDLTSRHYAGDSYGGVFEAHAWYRYNLQGNHQIWPTYDVYVVDTGDAVYKLQLIGYYGETGDSRQITFRYERLGT